MLQMHTNNIKATWGVLNDMIKKSGKKDFPTYFEKNDNSIIQNIEEIVNEFNEYFVNVGPNLAKEIDLPGEEEKCFDSPTNSNSMFLGGVCESDVLEVVGKFKNKKSTDSNTIDMSTLK